MRDIKTKTRHRQRLAKSAPRHIRLGVWMRHRQLATRLVSVFLAIIVGFGMFFEVAAIARRDGSYKLSSQASELVGLPSAAFGDSLKLDPKTQKFEYNQGYMPAVEVKGQVNAPRFTASFPSDPKQGMEVTDPESQTTITLKPQFALESPRKDQNRLLYPLKGKDAVKVISLKASGLKEDVVVNRYQGDTLRFEYDLQLPSGLEARLEPNGSLGIYGPDRTLLGNIQTGSEADAQLLDKARNNAKKSTLLFTLPAPFVKENGVTKSAAEAAFRLEGSTLTIEARKLDKATYPLSIDPSVYVETAQKLMRGNNETNVDFDVSNELIQKGVLTGARIPSWTNSTNSPLNAGRWGHGTAVTGGYIYTVGGSSGSSNVSTVYWAKLNTSTYDMDSPNPGAGACTDWCTNAAYDLPAPRSGLSIVAYNGYLYAIGGKDASCAGANTICGTVYKATIGANGEPISWTDLTGSPLLTARSYAGAVVYNNRIYVAGGQTNGNLNGVQSVEFANINPDGTLSAWDTAGMTLIPVAGRWGHSLQQYNGYLYLLGGASTTTTQNTVQYIKINANGSMASSWVTSTPFGGVRATYGGNFATIWGGYLYVTGGCSAMSTTNCSTILSGDTLQLASLNADGSVSEWTSISGVTQTRTGFGLVAWRNTLYAIGGCGAATTSSNCASALSTTNYGHINNDGDVSPPQSESTLPGIGGTGGATAGRTASGVVINNGFIYNIGGCGDEDCNPMNPNTIYASIDSAGVIGGWTVDSTDTLNGTTGLGAFGVTVYNNRVYVAGGTSGPAGGWRDDIFYASFNADGTLGAWTEAASNVISTSGNGSTSYTTGYSYMISRSANATTGNLYVISGCTGTGAGIGCGASSLQTTVIKCTITNSTGAVSDTCDDANQLQLSTGLALTAGSYYANYIYLAGGALNGGAGQIDTVYFATINSSNNIVRKDTGNATGGWDTTSTLPRVRRRATAFGANGFIYVVAGHDGTTGNIATLTDITYAKIDQTTGDLLKPSTGAVSSFDTLGSVVSQRWNHGTAAANGIAYVVGGCTTGNPPDSCTDATGMNGTVQSFQVYNNWNASPAAFTSETDRFTTDRYGAGAVVLNGYLYIAGGCTTATDCTTPTTNVSYAPLNDDGSVGAWTSASNVLPAARTHGTLEAVGGTLYYIGGQDASCTVGNGTGSSGVCSNVYYSTPSSGAPAAWATASNGLPAERTGLSTSVYNGRIYATGGASGAGTTQTTVYQSPSLTAGGNIGSTWTSTTAFTTARSGHVAVAYGNNLYILGGFDGTNYLMDTQYAPINTDGTVGSWTKATDLPFLVRQGDGFASNGFLYIFGGRSSASGCTRNTYVTPVNAEGSLGYWSQTNNRFNAERYGVATAYDSGKAYLLGGYNCASSAFTGNDRVIYTTLQFQPQIARYSYMIDTDTDVTPTKWLINGLDNGIGANWFLRYRSSTNTNNAWGQETNVGAVTLGTPGTYTPLDGSGTNTIFARYYYLSLTIDSQNAFGFPEDVSRGPNIYDLSLFFTSDPSKRLRHGKTFTGGQQQPLDTPFP